MYTKQFIVVLTFILLIILHIRLPKSKLVNMYLVSTWILFLVSFYITFMQKKAHIGLLLILFIHTILTFYYVKIKNKTNNRISIIIIILLWSIYSSFFIKNKESVMIPETKDESVMIPEIKEESVIYPIDTEPNGIQSFLNRVRRRLNKNYDSTLSDYEYGILLDTLATEDDQYIRNQVLSIFKANNLNKANKT